jgi:hypothetical protein
LKGVWNGLVTNVTDAEAIRDKASETTVPTTLTDWTLIGANYFRKSSFALMTEYQNTLAAEDCNGNAGAAGGTAGNTTTKVEGSVTTDTYGVDSNAYWMACSATTL